jgi:maleylacetate reductase
VAADFTFRDGERVIRFGPGVVAEAPKLLGRSGFDEYALLTTARAADQAPALAEGAVRVLHVPPGPVPEAAASVHEGVGGRPLVALGGGRVVDAAKAIGGADGLRVAAVPTTLAGSSFTPFHRAPVGVDGYGMVRPALVVADPGLMASMPEAPLTATAMNALAHASESLYAPGANPIAAGAALRAAELFARALEPGALDRTALALAALLGGYAIGTTGLGLHHALCQTIVRTAGTPHAETNAVMLSHTLRFMATRAPEPLGRLADALGRTGEGPEAAAEAVSTLAARAGPTTLGGLGVDAGAVPEIAAAATEHPVIAGLPQPPPSVEALRALLEAAL